MEKSLLNESDCLTSQMLNSNVFDEMDDPSEHDNEKDKIESSPGRASKSSVPKECFDLLTEFEVFQNHCKLEYHINATLDAEHFINVLEKKEKSIIEQLDSDRKRLVPIIECILLCGRQELALRGHRGEKGNILIDENAIQNAGNFLNEAQCFSVLADETTDISTTEQLTLCVRYIDSEGNLNEEFLKFIIVESLTGSDLSAAILNGLVECGLDCAFQIGQGYDGASNMSGKVQGVKSYIQTKYPKAIYVHCAAHSLNLAVSTASDLKPIRNCLGIIEKVYTFLNTPKRSAVMFHVIDNENADLNIKKLKRLCATRWIQRYDAVNDFCELLPYVMISLDKISEWRDSSGADASILKKAIDRFECLFSNQSSKEELESFNNLLEFYTPLIDSNNSTAELMLWKDGQKISIFKEKLKKFRFSEQVQSLESDQQNENVNKRELSFDSSFSSYTKKNKMQKKINDVFFSTSTRLDFVL
eukprot:XP_016659934.1 PREDICTED: zinc finger MYM-type protein 1-like [Acyrthosiphon pisum]